MENTRNTLIEDIKQSLLTFGFIVSGKEQPVAKCKIELVDKSFEISQEGIEFGYAFASMSDSDLAELLGALRSSCRIMLLQKHPICYN